MKSTNIFIKSTLVLIFGGLITKVLGFIIRILYIRLVGAEIIGLYSLVNPTYSLIITIATLALPTTVSKLIAEKKDNSSKIIFTSLVLIMFINFLVVIILLFSAKFIAFNLLHEERCYYLILSMALTFPIISISSIIKGYFYGKQNMVPNVVSNIIEQLIRGLLIYLIIPPLMQKNELLAACSLFFISFIEEFVSIIINLIFLPRKIKFNKKNFILDKPLIKSILSISIPCVSSRIVGNIGYFFEPILLKNCLLKAGFTNQYILLEYGYYNAYTIPILTVPSFFIAAISSALIPEISKLYANKNYYQIKKRLYQSLAFSLIIGIVYSILLLFFGEYILNIIYSTFNGLTYIKVLAPIFPLFYIEAILISFLQAINKSKITMNISIIGVIIKLLSIVICSVLKLGMFSLVISEIINIIVVVFLNIFFIYKSFLNHRYHSF